MVEVDLGSTMSSAAPTTSPSAPKSSISASDSVSGDPLQSINQSLTKIQTLLKGSLALDKMRADQRRKQQQQQKAQAREAALEVLRNLRKRQSLERWWWTTVIYGQDNELPGKYSAWFSCCEGS